MDSELIKTFNENRDQIGVFTREEVHRKGYWHETFHCWFIDKDSIYFQVRSAQKKDYPNLLDITAAGHILAHETIFDGIREVHEEIGIDVSYNSLVPVGIIKYCVVMENFIDKELANVFLYDSQHSSEEFNLQVEEVSAIVKINFEDFNRLWSNEVKAITVEGFNADQTKLTMSVTKKDFVPHEDSYYEAILKAISEHYEFKDSTKL